MSMSRDDRSMTISQSANEHGLDTQARSRERSAMFCNGQKAFVRMVGVGNTR